MSDVEYRWKALIAGSLLTLNLGSIHAFSVFVAPFEALYDATRGQVSLIYSLALVCLTLAVLGGHRIYSVVPAHLIALIVCTCAAAGLMAIAHAVGILRALEANQALAVAGAVCIAIGNALGGVLAGWLADRMPIRRLLMALPGLSTVALLVLAGSGSAPVALAALTVVGFGYGAVIAAYPMAAAVYFGPSQAARIYGRIFTAWGTAGLLAPWLAGFIFDSTGGYSLALVSAAVVALVSSASSAMLSNDDLRV